MMDSPKAVVPLAFCQKRLAGFTRRRWSQFAANHNADYKECGSAKFARIPQSFNGIDLRMNHAILTTAATQAAGHAILPNGQEFPPLADERYVILGGVFLGIPIDVGLDCGCKEMEKPGGQRFLRNRRATPSLRSYLCCS
jgi:hypothetical protein